MFRLIASLESLGKSRTSRQRCRAFNIFETLCTKRRLSRLGIRKGKYFKIKRVRSLVAFADDDDFASKSLSTDIYRLHLALINQFQSFDESREKNLRGKLLIRREFNFREDERVGGKTWRESDSLPVILVTRAS